MSGELTARDGIDALEAAAREERQRVTRVLLEDGVMLAGHQLFPLVRKHQERLMADMQERLGYALYVTPDTARLHKRFGLGQARPLPLPPRSAAEAKRPVDERRTLDARRCLMVCLLGAALERASSTWGTQVPLTELVGETLTEARTLEIAVDLKRSADLNALMDAVAWLTGQGVLSLLSGTEGRFGAQVADEAYYAIDRARLAGVLADALRVAGADTPAKLEIPEPDDPAGRRRGQRLTRALVEDPVLYVDDLGEDDKVYFLSPQRNTIEAHAGELTGLQVERRKEGTALVATRRELTDRPFPGQSHRKALTLLLLGVLCDAHETRRGRADDPQARITFGDGEVLALASELVAAHEEHWSWRAADSAGVRQAVDDALALLEELMLVRRGPDGLELLPAAHRFRDAQLRVSGTQTQLDI